MCVVISVQITWYGKQTWNGQTSEDNTLLEHKHFFVNNMLSVSSIPGITTCTLIT
jgi:hypothetical protein